MASTFTHAFVGLAAGKSGFQDKMPFRFWLLGMACSVLPDLDVIAFRLGIPYRHMLGHRGFSHSLLFAAIVGIIVTLLAFREVPRFSGRWWKLAFFFSAVIVSHDMLDAMTNGGYGVGFFIPFDNTRYFLPWRPLVVSPIGVHGFLSRWGWRVVTSELLWVWLPLLLSLFVTMIIGKRNKKAVVSSGV